MEKSNKYELILAPLRGVTVLAFREIFSAKVGGFDSAVAPFIPTVPGDRIKPAMLKDAINTDENGMRLIPQVIGKDPAQLVAMISALKELGHTEVNLNIGCPWKFVVKKGRGCGLLADEDRLKAMLDAGCSAIPGGFSVKTRLGITDKELLEKRVEIFNQYPLKNITIHPRTAEQMYEGVADINAFEKIHLRFKAPVVYNGDIFSVEDFKSLRKRFPQVSAWMIGRGAVMNPLLPLEIRNELDDISVYKTADAAEIRRKFAIEFHDALYSRYSEELFGPGSILGRMKELWGYLHIALGLSQETDAEFLRSVRHSKTFAEYEQALDFLR